MTDPFVQAVHDALDALTRALAAINANQGRQLAVNEAMLKLTSELAEQVTGLRHRVSALEHEQGRVIE